RIVNVKLDQGQFDAMVSIVYNVGSGRPNQDGKPGRDGIEYLRNGQPSTLLRKLNIGDYDGAAEQFDKWVYGGGHPLPGLVKRRADERKLFEGRA
ncbi:MAG: lysozyme, partial [Magnetococcales bacterium]|nr:lysozyme [Magnetococcales bacterium]